MKTAYISKKTMVLLACTLATCVYPASALPADCPSEGGVDGTQNGDYTPPPAPGTYTPPPSDGGVDGTQDGGYPAPSPAPGDYSGGADGTQDGGYPSPSPAPGDYSGGADGTQGGDYTPPDDCQGGSTGSANCPVDMHYAAALFQQANYAGIHSWVDGMEGECRGLNGTDVLSVKIVGFDPATQTSGDVVTNEASDDFAKGVSLTFYDDFACGGAEISTVDGTQGDVNVPMAKSVKIGCNGLGSGVFTAKEVSAVYPVAVTDVDGAKHWFSGSINECRGMEGNAFNSIQYLTADGVDPTVAANQADGAGVGMQFYADFGCAGDELDLVAGTKTTLDPAITAKSFMFVSTADDGSQSPMSESGAAQMTAGLSMVATAIFSLIFA